MTKFNTLSIVIPVYNEVSTLEEILRRVLDVADRVYVLRTGRIVLSGTAADLRDSPDLVEAYFGFAAEFAPQ